MYLRNNRSEATQKQYSSQLCVNAYHRSPLHIPHQVGVTYENIATLIWASFQGLCIQVDRSWKNISIVHTVPSLLITHT